MADSSEDKMPETLQFLNYVSKLKHLDRTGWIHHRVKKRETVAGHMYRMAIMSAFVIDDPTIDVNKCIKMSLVHDIGESIIGDITPHCGVSNETKYLLENSAVEKIASLVGKLKGDEIRQLFQEYEEGSTPEGKLVKGLDKFDMVMQAYEYELTEGKPLFLQEFFDSTKVFFETCHPKVKELVMQLDEAREKRIPFTR